LAPGSGLERSRLQQWLSFIGTELHKAIFVPLLDPNASESVKAYARVNIPLRFKLLEERLSRHEHLLSSYSIADAYLLTILNWVAATKDDLSQWPSVAAFQRRMMARASVAQAVSEEFTLYKEETARKRR
jgi:glutathione S-transferase